MKKKIFIIDDADFVHDMLRLILTGAGHEIAGSASDGLQALESIKKLISSGSEVDIIMVDFHMPKLDGVETIREIKKLLPKVKSLLITSNSTRSVVLRAKEAGVDSFIVKPFEPKTVLDAIMKL